MLKISVLTHLRGHFEALAVLQRIAAEVWGVWYGQEDWSLANRPRFMGPYVLGVVQVTPIMRSRGWVVQNYMEFLPDDPGLLGINVNRGEEVKIRCGRRVLSVYVEPGTSRLVVPFSVRHRGDSTTFIEYRELVGTTLHELCHMVRILGPFFATHLATV
jgi:WLM domain